MLYPSEDALLADLAHAVVEITGDPVQKAPHLKQVPILVEVVEPTGPRWHGETQAYYVASDGRASLGDLRPTVRDYLLLKRELAGVDYEGMTAADAEQTLKEKTVTGSTTVTWQTVAATIGLDRSVAVREALKAASPPWADDAIAMLQAGVDAGTPEFARTVGAVQSQTDLTQDEADALTALADVPWAKSNNITIRSHQVAAIVGG